MADPRPPTDREREKIIDYVADERAKNGRAARQSVEAAAVAVFGGYLPETATRGDLRTYAAVLWPSGEAEAWTIAEVARPVSG